MFVGGAFKICVATVFFRRQAEKSVNVGLSTASNASIVPTVNWIRAKSARPRVSMGANVVPRRGFSSPSRAIATSAFGRRVTALVDVSLCYVKWHRVCAWKFSYQNSIISMCE